MKGHFVKKKIATDAPIEDSAPQPQGWEQILAVDASLDRELSGAVYQLRYPDGTTVELGNADDRYHQLAHIIDSIYEERA